MTLKTLQYGKLDEFNSPTVNFDFGVDIFTVYAWV